MLHLHRNLSSSPSSGSGNVRQPPRHGEPLLQAYSLLAPCPLTGLAMMPQADADAADRAHPPENLNFHPRSRIRKKNNI